MKSSKLYIKPDKKYSLYTLRKKYSDSELVEMIFGVLEQDVTEQIFKVLE